MVKFCLNSKFSGVRMLKTWPDAEVDFCGDTAGLQGLCCNVHSATYWNEDLTSCVYVH